MKLATENIQSLTLKSILFRAKGDQAYQSCLTENIKKGKIVSNHGLNVSVMNLQGLSRLLLNEYFYFHAAQIWNKLNESLILCFMKCATVLFFLKRFVSLF